MTKDKIETKQSVTRCRFGFEQDLRNIFGFELKCWLELRVRVRIIRVKVRVRVRVRV